MLLSQIYLEMIDFLKHRYIYIGRGRRDLFSDFPHALSLLSLFTLLCTQRTIAQYRTSEAENMYQPLSYLISSNIRLPEPDLNAVPCRQNDAGIELSPTFLPVFAYILEALKHSCNCVTYTSP